MLRHLLAIAPLFIVFLAGCGPSQSMRDAVRNVSLSDVQKHIQQGFDVNGPVETGGSGNTLHYAAFHGRSILRNAGSERAGQAYRDIVAALIAAGADIETRNDRGKTPLHLAALDDCVVAAEVLLEHGAEVDARSKPEGMTALYIDLCSWPSDDKYDASMAELLVAWGADVNAATSDGSTPLHRAAANRMPEVCKLLLDHGATVNAQDGEGRTPVTCGAVNEDRAEETIDLLLAHGADISIPDYQGRVVNQNLLIERARLLGY